jgi:hypothetical protein
VLKRGDFERLGVHALHFVGDNIRLETGWPDSRNDGLRRPWLQRVEIPFKPKPKPTGPDLEPSFN